MGIFQDLRVKSSHPMRCRCTSPTRKIHLFTSELNANFSPSFNLRPNERIRTEISPFVLTLIHPRARHCCCAASMLITIHALVVKRVVSATNRIDLWRKLCHSSKRSSPLATQTTPPSRPLGHRPTHFSPPPRPARPSPRAAAAAAAGNYLAHTQGKRHQTNISRRAAKDHFDAQGVPALAGAVQVPPPAPGPEAAAGSAVRATGRRRCAERGAAEWRALGRRKQRGGDSRYPSCVGTVDGRATAQERATGQERGDAWARGEGGARAGRRRRSDSRPARRPRAAAETGPQDHPHRPARLPVSPPHTQHTLSLFLRSFGLPLPLFS